MVVDKRLYRNPVQRVLRTGRQGCAQGHLCDRDKVRLIRCDGIKLGGDGRRAVARGTRSAPWQLGSPCEFYGQVI
jgi:hypothetical protein